MTSIGLKLDNPLPIRENVFLARYAEARGLDAAWVSEFRRDAMVQAAALAAGTERIKVGTAIVPIYTRSTPVLAMSAAALADLAPGRVVFGLGTSTGPIVEGWHERERPAPITDLRRAVEDLRAALAGERTSSGFKLDLGQVGPPEAALYTAALEAKALDAAATYADGVLLSAVPIRHLPAIRERLATAAGAGRPAPALAGDVRIGIGDAEEVARMRAAQRKAMATYARGPAYNRMFAEAGFAAEAEAIRTHWEAGDTEAAIAAIGDDLLDEIVAIGSPEEVADRLRAFAAAGFDEILAVPIWDEGTVPADAARRVVDLTVELGLPGRDRVA